MSVAVVLFSFLFVVAAVWQIKMYITQKRYKIELYLYNGGPIESRM